jgi:small basic protein
MEFKINQIKVTADIYKSELLHNFLFISGVKFNIILKYIVVMHPDKGGSIVIGLLTKFGIVILNNTGMKDFIQEHFSVYRCR